MTHSSPKPSLMGRKRTKELLDPKTRDPISEVQKNLLDLQENLKQDVTVKEKSKPETPVTPKAAPKKEVTRVTFEQEAFEYLLELHRNLKNPHQAIRVSYSVSEQNRRLLEAIKKVINRYGESLKHSNLNQKEIAQKCQNLLDTLVSRLIREGVKLRHLSVVPDHR